MYQPVLLHVIKVFITLTVTSLKIGAISTNHVTQFYAITFEFQQWSSVEFLRIALSCNDRLRTAAICMDVHGGYTSSENILCSKGRIRGAYFIREFLSLRRNFGLREQCPGTNLFLGDIKY